MAEFQEFVTVAKSHIAGNRELELRPQGSIATTADRNLGVIR